MTQIQRTREHDLDDAMARLNRRAGALTCLKDYPYSGNIQRDIELVLEELHRLRQEMPTGGSPAKE